MAVDDLTTVRVRDAAGQVVLDLASGGYRVALLGEEQQIWARRLSTSPFVDGDSEDGARLESFVLAVAVRIEGATWAQVEQRRLALRAATTVPSWLLEIESAGVVTLWRAGRADSRSVAAPEDIDNLQRTVTMSIPLQPTPTVTGL